MELCANHELLKGEAGMSHVRGEFCLAAIVAEAGNAVDIRQDFMGCHSISEMLAVSCWASAHVFF